MSSAFDFVTVHSWVVRVLGPDEHRWSLQDQTFSRDAFVVKSGEAAFLITHEQWLNSGGVENSALAFDLTLWASQVAALR